MIGLRIFVSLAVAGPKENHIKVLDDKTSAHVAV